MSPQVQSLLVLTVVAAAAIYVGRKVWLAIAKARRQDAGPGCGTDGCCK